jgi:hypothetical protein
MKAQWIKSGGFAMVLLLGGPAMAQTPAPVAPPLPAGSLPTPPANGVLGFVVSIFQNAIERSPDACPDGPVKKIREVYLDQLDATERNRLLLKENEPELTKRWQATVFGANGTNICSQPQLFDRPLIATVQSKRAYGLDLDGGTASADICPHGEFVSPAGEAGVDNQEYRVLGCTLEWRGKDGQSSDQEKGMQQFHVSGQWTQAILLRGVDSLVNDPEVEVIYGNTPDRPVVDSKGNFLPGASFTLSDTAPRHRNALKGRIVNGVLMTAPADIRLTQTWGQGGARDIRGNRTMYEYRKGRLHLAFQPDGSLEGVIGGYRLLFDTFQSAAIGGAGAALVAGIDCAAYLATLRKYADGLRDPATGQCTAVSSAMRMKAVPAFVNDVPQEGENRP